MKNPSTILLITLKYAPPTQVSPKGEESWFAINSPRHFFIESTRPTLILGGYFPEKLCIFRKRVEGPETMHMRNPHYYVAWLWISMIKKNTTSIYANF